MPTGVRDQAGGAFGSAAVPRPLGSSLMPLRRTPHRPDLVRWLEPSAKRHESVPALPIRPTGVPALGAPTVSPAAGADGVSQRG